MPPSEEHGCPSRLVQATVELEGSHSWHSLAGLICFALYSIPPMKQTPATHVPLMHTPTPLPQMAPSGNGVHTDVAVEGSQSWQALLGLTDPAT